jgi:hypothetical protein
MLSYTAIAELAELVLEDSYVLDITVRPGVVVVALDLVLTPKHSAYQPPRAGEWACFRRGQLRFEAVREVHWVHSDVPPSIDATGERDYDNIDVFEWQNQEFRLEGDWGQLVITSAPPVVVFDPPVTPDRRG